MELFQHCLKVVTREFPLEWRSNVLIILLEAEESVFDFGKRVEVVGRECFAFNGAEHKAGRDAKMTVVETVEMNNDLYVTIFTRITT
jgi:hypothetical protein